MKQDQEISNHHNETLSIEVLTEIIGGQLIVEDIVMP